MDGMRGCVLQVVGLVILMTGTIVLADGWEAKVVLDGGSEAEGGPYRIQMPKNWFRRARIVNGKGETLTYLSYKRTDQLARLIPYGEPYKFDSYPLDGRPTTLRMDQPIEVLLNGKELKSGVREIIVPTEIGNSIVYEHPLWEMASALPRKTRERWKWRDPSVGWGRSTRGFVYGLTVGAFWGVGLMETRGSINLYQFGESLDKWGGISTFLAGAILMKYSDLEATDKRFGPISRIGLITGLNCAAHLALFLLP